MAERRELTERNRENQQPGQPIDFCQGLPFKVRWMGRDAQTGRDLVQFPDGSIVRAGKRIFSGNCPRGTMVDVVDCGSNGFITIDWRDAEIRQPLLTPEVPKDWSIIIDGSQFRFLPGFFGASKDFNEGYPGSIDQYLTNLKQGKKVLLFGDEEQFQNLEVLLSFVDERSPGGVFETDPTKIEEIKVQIETHDQLWIICPILLHASPLFLDLVVGLKKPLFLLLDNTGSVAQVESAPEILRAVLGDETPIPSFSGDAFLPELKQQSDDPFNYYPMGLKMELDPDPLFTGVASLPSGTRFGTAIDVAGTNFKVIGRRYNPPYLAYQEIDGDVQVVNIPSKLVPIIAVMR